MKITRKVVFIGGAVVLVIITVVLLAVFLKKGSDDSEQTDVVETTEAITTTESSLPQDSVVVAIRDGKIAGEWIDAVQGNGVKFAAFRGIPYAQPPIGDLRFKGPKPPVKWDNVRLATKEGSACSQGDSGSEDCLFLNVYTPRLPTAATNPELAVYFFIHGGGFVGGNANMNEWGPDFLIQHDIVVVTMNYRVNIMASLSLDTDDVPGNAGLKDQLQALRWVHDNIAVFGGDPTKVTLGGHSSGAASAHLLSILPQTKGLIRSATIQSGPAVASWGHNDKNIKLAKAIYEHLTGNQTDDLSEITKVVKSAPYSDLWNAAVNASALLKNEESIGSALSIYYTPNIERRVQGTEEKLVTRDAESYFMNGNDIPIILGETKEEWTQFFSEESFFNDEVKLNAVIQNLKIYVPGSILPGPDTKEYLGINATLVSPAMEDEFLREIQDYFFKNNSDESCNTNCKMAKYMHQAYVLVDTSYSLRLRSKYSAHLTYAYQFNLKSDYNANLDSLPTYLQRDVIHDDDRRYIWHEDSVGQDYNADTVASRTVRRMVTMYANFIKHGNPTPQTDDLIDVTWQPVRHGDAETYLEITEKLTQRAASLAGDSISLWSKIYSAYRGGSSP